MKPDAVVVGGGIIGLTSAWALHRAGLRVQLLERGSTGREASWAGGGILSPLNPWRFPAPVNRLARLSQALFPDFVRELVELTGIDPEWLPSGLLAWPDEDVDTCRTWAEAMGVPLELWRAADVAVREPALRWPGAHAIRLPKVAQIRNPRLLKALRQALEREGVVIHEQEPATAILVEDGRVQGVRTSAADYHTSTIVAAAGAWTAPLLAPHGTAPPVRPVRGQMLLFRAEPDQLGHIALFGDHYLIPRRDGHILAGSTVEEAGFDSATTPEARRWLAEHACARMPALRDAPVAAHWSGLRPGNPRETPFIGAHPEIAGLYVSSGHYRNGLVLAPGSAQLLRQIITGEPPSLDPADYALTGG